MRILDLIGTVRLCDQPAPDLLKRLRITHRRSFARTLRQDRGRFQSGRIWRYLRLSHSGHIRLRRFFLQSRRSQRFLRFSHSNRGHSSPHLLLPALRSFIFLLYIDRKLRNQLPTCESLLDRLIHLIIDLCLICKAHLHLCRVDIYIHKSRIDLYRQNCKRIAVVHHKRLIGVLDRTRDDRAFYVPPVYKIIFIIPVSA